MENMDWKLLREQKDALLNYALIDKPIPLDIADGLINLIDALQDKAVDEDGVASHEVFGYLIAK